MPGKFLILLIVLTMLSGLVAASLGCKPLPPQPRLRVATTTSLYDTGLWEYLEPMFKEKYKVELHIIYAGTGIALEYGRRGDVDVLTIHDQASEEQFIAEGYGLARVPFAYNYFLIVGPAIDPMGIRGLTAEEAFKKLMASGKGSFISRGDDSGTHAREKVIWKEAGFDYEMVRKAGAWYIEAGRGMGPTLLMAGEKQAYTLADTSTFLAYKGRMDLVPIVDRGEILLNVYSAIVVTPQKHLQTNIKMANNLISFLTSPEIQKLIGNYGLKEYGMPLFIPVTAGSPNS